MIAIISDIHGNYPALKAVLEEIDKKGCKFIISIGDVAGYYCMINECIEELRRRKISNILGNHDAYLLGEGKCPRSTTVNQCIEYQKHIITQENIRYIENSVMGIDNHFLSARHGGWNDPLDEYIDNFDFGVHKKLSAHFFISGHTHIQKKQQQEDIVYFNPGSVGQPRDHDSRAAYAIIDDNNKVNLYRVKYNIMETFQIMKKHGFSDRISECLFLGSRIKTFGS